MGKSCIFVSIYLYFLIIFYPMVKMKEGFKGERFASLPDNLLETYSKDPLIGDLFLRKIGYFPRVKYHYIQKEHGCDYTMLIYCTDGEGWYEIYGEKHIRERMNTSYFRRILLMLLGPTMKIPGLSIGCILKARTVNTTSREVVFRAALPPTIIHAFKTACCCLRKSTIVFLWHISRNTCGTLRPACICSCPLSFIWNSTVPYRPLSIRI